MSNSFTDLYPDSYMDETGNTRIDGTNVSLNNSLDVTAADITARTPMTFASKQYNESDVYFKNQLISNISELPEGFVTIGFDQDIAYFASKDFPGVYKYIDARGFRIVTENTFQLSYSDEFLVIGSSASNPYVIDMPADPKINMKTHYVGSALGTETPNITLDAGNIEIVMHVRSSTGILQEAHRDTTLVVDTGYRQSFRCIIVGSPPVPEWHGTVGVYE